MAKKAVAKKAVANRHLVCCDCSCWIQFDTSECTIPWAEMKGSIVFKCKGCTEVARLVGEVEYLRKMMGSLKRMVTGQGLEETSGETGGREAMLEEAEESEKCVGEKTRDNSSTEESEVKKICSGTPITATHSYRKNQDSPLGKELDLQQGDIPSYILEQEDNEHWWLAEHSKGQVGYVPVSHLMPIMDETIQEEGCDRTRKEVQGKSTDETKIGGDKRQEGESRNKYSAAVIEGIKRNATTYVGDSIVRKTDVRLSKGEDVVVCLPGARIEHVTERVDKIMGRGKGGTILVHVGTNNTDKEGTTAIVDKFKTLLKKTNEARVGQIILSGILPVLGNRIDGYRNSKRTAINGMMKRLCKEEYVGYVYLWDSFVGKEEMYARDGLHLSWKGADALAEGLSGAVASGLGKVRYLNLLGRGVCQRRL